MIDKKSCKMKLETYSSIQIVKYAMMAKVIQPQIDLQVFPKEKQTNQSFASPVTWKKYEIFQTKLWGDFGQGKAKSRIKERKYIHASVKYSNKDYCIVTSVSC